MLLPKFLLAAGCLLLAASVQATTYYIAANGSDSNNGASKSTPWLHAPGMNGCVGNCASKSPQAGDQFILHGGDTWHNPASGQTPVGLPWNISWNGTASSAIYFGVDQTWFNAAVCGSSWCQPKLNGDNPLSVSSVSKCTYKVPGGNTFVGISGDYTTFDNIEFLGLCWDNNSAFGDDTYLGLGEWGSNLVSNVYMHGWTHPPFNCTCTDPPTGVCDSGQAIVGPDELSNCLTGQCDTFAGIRIDGADSDPTSMAGIYGDGYDIHNSIFRNNSNAVVIDVPHTFHDNLFENIYEPVDNCAHGNVFEFNGEWDGTNNYVYNNIVRNTHTAVTVWTCPNKSDVYYNNVVYNTLQQPWDLDTSCGGSATFINNTFADTGGPIGNTLGTAPMTLDNTLFINAEHTTPISGTETKTISMTDAQATAAGYTASTNYAPANSMCNGKSPCPLGAGQNMTSSCSTAGAALCSDTSAGNTRTPVARPASGAWDVGAYQFSSSSATFSACDTNQDGQTNVSDVQLEVNMALGINSCINADGQCTVVQVQRVVNAALGGQCVIP